MRTRMISAALALVMLGPAGCKVEKTEREMLIEASLAAQQGHTDEARAIFESAYEANPESAEILIRYTGFLIDNDELDQAWTLLEALDGMDLADPDQGRVDTERRRYFDAIYGTARGEGPAGPADAEAYERALIGLIELDPRSPKVAEWVEYLMMHGRSALGARADAPIAIADAGNPAARATPEQARAALAYFDRVVDGDERMSVRPRLDAETRAEVQAVRQILQATVFRAEFDQRFTSDLQPALVAAGRFDATSRNFTIAYQTPLPAELPEDAAPELLQQQAQTYFAREIATDLTYELAGAERGDAPPLGYAAADFGSAVATEVTVTPAAEPATPDAEPTPAMLSFQLALPYTVIQRGAWLLHLRQLEAAPAAEGSGAGEGSGE